MTKTIDAIVDFAGRAVAPELDLIAASRLVNTESLATQTWNHYTDPTGQFFAGVWAAAPGTMTVHYTEEELCVILEGRVKISDNTGASKTFGPGDSFTIPAGFSGTWENLDPVRKIYAIWQPPG